MHHEKEVDLEDGAGEFDRRGAGELDRRGAGELIEAFDVNLHQVHQYLASYVHLAGDFPPSEFARLSKLYSEIDVTSRRVLAKPPTNTGDPAVRALLELYAEYFRHLKETCQRIWSKFDLPCIILGLLSFTFALLWHLLIDFTCDPISPSGPQKWATLLMLVCHFPASLFFFTLLQTQLIEDGAQCVLLAGLSFLGALLLCLCYALLKSLKSPQTGAPNTLNEGSQAVPPSTVKSPRRAGCAWMTVGHLYRAVQSHWPVGLLVIYLGAMFSNSFIVNEINALCYLTQTAIALYFLQVHRASYPAKRKRITHPIAPKWLPVCSLAAGAFVCTRAGLQYAPCREEELVAWCNPADFSRVSIHDAGLGSAEKALKLGLALGTLAILYYTYRKWVELNVHYTEFSAPTVRAIVAYLLPLQTLLIGAYWVLDSELLQMAQGSSFVAGISLFLPRLVYSITVSIICIVLLRPQDFCAFVQQRKLTDQEKRAILLRDKLELARDSGNMVGFIRDLYGDACTEATDGGVNKGVLHRSAASKTSDALTNPATKTDSCKASKTSADVEIEADGDGEPIVYALGLSTLFTANSLTLLVAVVNSLLILIGIEFAPGTLCYLITLLCLLEFSGSSVYFCTLSFLSIFSPSFL